MNSKVYSVEDPVESRIENATQVGAPPNLPQNQEHCRNLAALNPENWRMDGMLAELSNAVAYERPEGGMALSSWIGDTRTVWATFDVSPPPPLVYMRGRMVSAVDSSQPRPYGAIKVICFLKKQN